MQEEKCSIDILESIRKHIASLTPLMPKQALVCVGEYSIKMILKEPYINKIGNTLPVLIEKSSDDIYKWVPKSFEPQLVLGFEDANIDTHFWYNATSYIVNDNRLIDGLKSKPTEKMGGAIIVSSVWDGIGSASLPTLISKFSSSSIKSLSIAVLPSKMQPPDAYFNAFASLGMCMSNDAAAVVLLDRDYLESYVGVDRDGFQLKGSLIGNYLVNMLLAKEGSVEEISELSRAFNVKTYAAMLAMGASAKIYGSIENMLDSMLLKPLLNFDLSTASLVYVLLRMPSSLKEKFARGKVELAIAGWFKQKADLKSIYISEPIYVEEAGDRVDVTLLVGGFDIAEMFSEFEKKIKPLKNRAIEKEFVNQEEWQVIAENLGKKKENNPS